MTAQEQEQEQAHPAQEQAHTAQEQEGADWPDADEPDFDGVFVAGH